MALETRGRYDQRTPSYANEGRHTELVITALAPITGSIPAPGGVDGRYQGNQRLATLAPAGIRGSVDWVSTTVASLFCRNQTAVTWPGARPIGALVSCFPKALGEFDIYRVARYHVVN
jgi:hypothetical protein